MRKFQKISAIVLVVAMVLSLMSISVFAADSTQEVHYILESTPVVDGQFTLNVYVADNASGTIQNADGFYLTTSQLELVYDNTILSIEDQTKRPNSYFGGVAVTSNGLIKLAALDAAGKEFKGKETPAAVFACTVIDTTKSSVTITPQNALAIDENADTVPSNLTYMSDPLVIQLGGSEPDPTATVEPDPEVPTATPDAPATEAPTATPAAQKVTFSTGSAITGRDYNVTINRTDASEEATVTVVITPESGAAPITKTETFKAGEKKLVVTFTADEIEAIIEKGDSFNVGVAYKDSKVEENYSKDDTMRAPGGGGNSGFSTTPGGVIVPSATPGLSTEPTATPSEDQPTTAPVETSVFTDVPASYWGYSYIMDLYNNGIVNGVSATEFMPEANVTRAEFTKMAAGIFNLTATSATSQFTDVPAGEWFAPFVIAATEAGIVQGISATEFGPDENITREQMATIIGRQLGMTSTNAVNFTDAASIEAYALPYVAALSEAGYLTGDNGMFNPKANATRAEAATLLDRVYVATKPTEAPEVTAEPETTEVPEATEEPDASATPDASEAPEATATPAE